MVTSIPVISPLWTSGRASDTTSAGVSPPSRRQSTPASSKKFYESQMALWAPIVKASGAKVE